LEPTGGFNYHAISSVLDILDVPQNAREFVLDRFILMINLIQEMRKEKSG